MVAQVRDDGRHEGRRDGRVLAEDGAHQEVQVDLDVRDVVLVGEGDDRPAHGRGDVLVHRVHALGLGLRQQEPLGRVGDLALLEDHLLDLAQVVQLRHRGGALRDERDLGVALHVGEDVRVGDRDDVERAVEVRATHHDLAGVVVDLALLEVGVVDPVQDPQRPAHRGVQARVDGGEHGHALLDERERGADRLVLVRLAQLVEAGADDALARLDHEPEQLQQHRARLVVRQRHDGLADVVDVQRRFDLVDRGRVD